MCSALKNVDSDQLRTHIIGFKYYWHYFSPTYTVGNVIYHLYQLSGQVSHTKPSPTFSNSSRSKTR